jgi:putative protein kinase ArgK-like GTPase of G3E family
MSKSDVERNVVYRFIILCLSKVAREAIGWLPKVIKVVASTQTNYNTLVQVISVLSRH